MLLEAAADPDDAAALLEVCETRWAAGVLGSQPPAGVEEAAWGNDLSVPVAWQTRFAHIGHTGGFLRADLVDLRDRMRLLVGLLADHAAAGVGGGVHPCVRARGVLVAHQGRRDGATALRPLPRPPADPSRRAVPGRASQPRTAAVLDPLQIATNRRDDEPDPETGGRIVALTVHKAKGLEYDRVVVPSTDRSFGPPRSVETRTAVLRAAGEDVRLLWRWHLNKGRWNETDYSNVPVARQHADWGTDDEDTAREEARLLYVAMTRAKEEPC